MNLIEHSQRHVNAAIEAKAQDETTAPAPVSSSSTQKLKVISYMERSIGESIQVSTETVAVFTTLLRSKVMV